jgi:hypothetical protein
MSCEVLFRLLNLLTKGSKLKDLIQLKQTYHRKMDRLAVLMVVRVEGD